MANVRAQIPALQEGKTVKFRPTGNSMTPKIMSGQLVTVEPVTEQTVIEKGDIVLCKVKGNVYVHLVTAIQGDTYQISNNHGHVNGWTPRKNIYGKLVSVEP